LSALRWSSQDLLIALQSIHLKHNVTQLAAHAAETCDIGRAVSRSHLDTSHSLRFVVVGSELERAIASLRQERTLDLRVIVQRFGHGIPAIAGDAQAVYRLFHSLLEYATQSCADTPAHGGLLIEPYVQQYSDTISDVATQQPRSCIPYVVIVVHQSTEAMPVPKEAFPQPMSGSDFLKAHDLVGQYGGSIEIRPAGPAPLQLILRLPAADSPQFSMIAGKAIQARRTHAEPASTMPARTSTRSPVRFRRHGRTMLQVPVELTIGSTAWQTTAMDIGVGGMRLAVGEQFPPMDNQPVSLIIRTPVSFLELPGIGRHRVTTTIAHISRHVFIEFASLLHTEAAVLKSLIESLQEQSIMMKLEIAIHGTPDRPS
jgi:hypothetical protein